MTTDEVLGGGVELRKSLHISSSDTFVNLGNTSHDDIPEVVVNGFEMQPSLILLVGVVCDIKETSCIGDLNYPWS